MQRSTPITATCTGTRSATAVRWRAAAIAALQRVLRPWAVQSGGPPRLPRPRRPSRRARGKVAAVAAAGGRREAAEGWRVKGSTELCCIFFNSKHTTIILKTREILSVWRCDAQWGRVSPRNQSQFLERKFCVNWIGSQRPVAADYTAHHKRNNLDCPLHPIPHSLPCTYDHSR